MRRSTPHFPRISMMACTTLGSARVDTSPSSLSALTAILRRMRRMILPLRVLGRPAARARRQLAAARRIAGLPSMR